MSRLPLLAGLLCLTLASPAHAQPQDGGETEALRQRIEQLRSALAGDVCANQETARALLAGGGVTATPVETQKTAALSDKPLSRKELVERLHQSVVMVVAGRDTGSGFFVTPDTVVTNNHVVEDAGTSPVMVIGRDLGAPRAASVIAHTGTKGQNERDYAILKIQGSPGGQPLPLATATTELASVIAAGFPGLLLDNDMNFRALIRGDLKAMPDLALAQGSIMAIQNRDRGLATLAHSAPISGGNSGGPLVDSCGRAVGINTFINVAVQQASSAGFAIATPDLIAYLGQNGITPTLQGGNCGE